MTVKELATKLQLTVKAGEVGMDKEIEGAYICDLLSWVMSHAQKGSVWVTVQTNVNIVAVAVLTEVASIIIPEDISIDQQTIDKANKENIPLLSSSLTGYELAIALNNNQQ